MILRDSWFGNKLHELYRKYLIIGNEYISGREYLKRRLILLVIIQVLIFALEFTNFIFVGLTTIVISLISLGVADIVLAVKRSFSAGFGTLSTTCYVLIALFSGLVFALLGDPLSGAQTSQLNNEMEQSLMRWAIFCTPVIYGYTLTLIFTNSRSYLSKEVEIRARELEANTLNRIVDLTMILEKAEALKTNTPLMKHHFVFPSKIKTLQSKGGIYAKTEIIEKLRSDSGSEFYCMCCVANGAVTPISLIAETDIKKVRKKRLQQGRFLEADFHIDLVKYLNKDLTS